MNPLARLTAARRRWGRLGVLAELSDDERRALVQLARVQAKDNVAARDAGAIDPAAWVSPLASIRFAERVSIAAGATVGPYCCVWGGWSTTWARIGTDALLSPGVVLVAGNHEIGGTGPVREQGFDEADVEIGPGAWIGAHAVVVGCRVGAGAVVGANAVVTQDVPDHAIAVGSPARVVGWRHDDARG
ncbi:MAG TPA: acyltransferase [Mycobacteriales bacterium]|nr:acyltransferase [Mycobacteriales bacterium]